MKTITSRDNPLYKQLKLLAGSSQARRKAGRALLDGVHLCEVYLQQVGEPAICVASESAQAMPEVAAILARCQSRHVQAILLPDSLYGALSQVEHGVGLMFLVDVPSPKMPGRLDGAAVLLDNLQDPGNLGSILRSAAAAGIPNVFCSRHTVFAWSPKVLRAGMGAHFLLKIHEDVDLADLLRTAKVPVMATSSHVRRTIYDADLRGPVAWLFGNEGQGVSPELLARATEQLAVPHLGAVESLNVAACAAVCFFEQVRQKTTSA